MNIAVISVNKGLPNKGVVKVLLVNWVRLCAQAIYIFIIIAMY